jgi:hypothetical protein
MDSAQTYQLSNTDKGFFEEYEHGKGHSLMESLSKKTPNSDVNEYPLSLCVKNISQLLTLLPPTVSELGELQVISQLLATFDNILSLTPNLKRN